MTGQGFSIRLQIAWRLAEARLNADLEQGEVGARVGKRLRRAPYSQGTVSRWLRGSEPPLAVIEALAGELGVSPGWLAFGDGPDPATTSGALASAREVGGSGGTGRSGG